MSGPCAGRGRRVKEQGGGGQPVLSSRGLLLGDSLDPPIFPRSEVVYVSRVCDGRRSCGGVGLCVGLFLCLSVTV